MTDTSLITPRRNFLVRALGFTAAGATLAVPIITVDSAEKRLAHHLAGVEAAFRDLFPGVTVDVRGNCIDGNHAFYQERLLGPDDPGRRADFACAMITAGPSLAWEARFQNGWTSRSNPSAS